MNKSVASELLQAMMAKRSELDAPDQRSNREVMLALVEAAVAVAVERRFSADTPGTEITDFVVRARESFPEEPMGPAIIMEGLIRARLGEDGLLDGLADHEAVPYKLKTAYAIIKDLDLDERRYDQVITDIVHRAVEDD